MSHATRPPATPPVWRSEARRLSLHHRHAPTPAVLALLEATTWGAEAVRYQVRRMDEIIGRIPDPHILTLEDDDGRLAGCVVAGRKPTRVRGRPSTAVHLAMIAIDPGRTGQGLGPLLTRQAKPVLLDLIGDHGLIHVYVEATHGASVEMHRRLGYDDVCTVDARVLARLAARDRREVRPLEGHEAAAAVALLDEAYGDHVLADFDVSLRPADYLVLTENGRIIAGAQASLMHWSLEKLEGLGGFIALHVLPRIPILGRGFDPRDIRFLRFSSLYARPGHEAALTAVLETALARARVHAGMMLLDPRSPVTRRLAPGIGAAGMGGLVKGSANVLAAFKGLTPEEIAWAKGQPLLVSPIDAI